MVERFHRHLKDGLRARCEGKDWLSHLPYVLLGLRAAPKEEADISSAEVTFGAPLVLPLQMHPEEELHGTQSPEVQILNTTGMYAEVLRGGSNALQEADYVYVRNGAQGGPLTPMYSGPFKILQLGGKALQLMQTGSPLTGSSRMWEPVVWSLPSLRGEAAHLFNFRDQNQPRTSE